MRKFWLTLAAILLIFGICFYLMPCSGNGRNHRNSLRIVDVLAEIEIPREIPHEDLNSIRLSCSTDCEDILVTCRNPNPFPDPPNHKVYGVLHRERSGKINFIQKPQSDGRWVVDGRVVSETGVQGFQGVQPRPSPETVRRFKKVYVDIGKRYEIEIEQPGGKELEDMKAILQIDGTRFENIYETPVFPSEHLMQYVFHGGGPGNEGLFAFYNNKKIEITEPAPNNRLDEFNYDPLKHRVMYQGTVFDLGTKARRAIPVFVGNDYVEFFIIPGHDLLVRQLRYNVDDDPEADYTDSAGDLEVCNLYGEPFAALRLQKNRKTENWFPFSIAASKNLIAYTLKEKDRLVIRVHGTGELRKTN
ncbi:hypothetical protein LLG95_02935 [bacterium]|nr:hypothetical protein [bacterium]